MASHSMCLASDSFYVLSQVRPTSCTPCSPHCEAPARWLPANLPLLRVTGCLLYHPGPGMWAHPFWCNSHTTGMKNILRKPQSEGKADTSKLSGQRSSCFAAALMDAHTRTTVLEGNCMQNTHGDPFIANAVQGMSAPQGGFALVASAGTPARAIGPRVLHVAPNASLRSLSPLSPLPRSAPHFLVGYWALSGLMLSPMSPLAYLL